MQNMQLDLPDDILVEVFSYLTVEDIVLRIRHANERWVAVAENSNIWKTLTYRPTLRFSEKEIIDFLKQAPKLQWFVPPCGYTTTPLLMALMKYSKNIRNLELNMAEATCELLGNMVKECPNIETITVIDDNFGGTRCLQIISQFPNLKTLRLNDEFYLTSASGWNHEYILADLAIGSPSLQCLDLRNLKCYSSVDLELLLEKKKYDIVTLFLNCSCRDGRCPLSVVGCCINLEVLHVENGCFLPCPSEVSRALKNISNLKTFSIPRFRYSDAKFLTDYFESDSVQSLVKVNLSGYKHFDTTLIWTIFEKCLSLRQLNLKECPDINDQSLEKIYLLNHLEVLNLACCNEITDRGIAHIVECTNLKYLNLNECKKLTNESFVLCYINLKMLLELHVNSCDIDPKSMLELPKYLKKLKVLSIYLSKMGKQTITAFKSRMPNVELRH